EQEIEDGREAMAACEALKFGRSGFSSRCGKVAVAAKDCHNQRQKDMKQISLLVAHVTCSASLSQTVGLRLNCPLWATSELSWRSRQRTCRASSRVCASSSASSRRNGGMSPSNADADRSGTEARNKLSRMRAVAVSGVSS